jgi:soluble lytic murein transglycosylase-like protein
MRPALIFAQVLSAISICWAQTPKPQERIKAEYYVESYAHRYKVPVALVRAIVEHESNWQPCVASPKGAVGLGVRDRCNLEQNISGGVRYLAWLMRLFHDDLRLVVAAYYAGEDAIRRRTLAYRNPDVVAYVARIRTAYLRETSINPRTTNTSSERDVR